jgi:hypothetical protein
VVRKDLTPSQQAVQAQHALLEAAKHLKVTNWNDHPHLVLCGVNSLQKLLNCSAYLKSHGIDHAIWTEPDINGEPTALATTLITGEIRKTLRKYQLLQL